MTKSSTRKISGVAFILLSVSVALIASFLGIIFAFVLALGGVELNIGGLVDGTFFIYILPAIVFVVMIIQGVKQLIGDKKKGVVISKEKPQV